MTDYITTETTTIQYDPAGRVNQQIKITEVTERPSRKAEPDRAGPLHVSPNLNLWQYDYLGAYPRYGFVSGNTSPHKASSNVINFNAARDAKEAQRDDFDL